MGGQLAPPLMGGRPIGSGASRGAMGNWLASPAPDRCGVDIRGGAGQGEAEGSWGVGQSGPQSGRLAAVHHSDWSFWSFQSPGFNHHPTLIEMH